MISRRLLRIKAIHALYAHTKSAEVSIEKAEKNLFYSINKTYDLYHYVILLLEDISAYARKKIEMSKTKFVPTDEDLNPKTKFIDNLVIAQLSNNKAFRSYIDIERLSWDKHPELIKKLYDLILESDNYKTYILAEERSYHEDREFVFDILEKIFPVCDDLHMILEEQSIYWNDDIEFILSMIIKTLRRFKARSTPEERLMSLYRNDEDKDYVRKLFRQVILKKQEQMDLISKYAVKWDTERIAFMDIIILRIAITELTQFPQIPANVTFNEYIEIAKYYSTEKSSVFINGILDKIYALLLESGQIKKEER